jgi:hypothetical protein
MRRWLRTIGRRPSVTGSNREDLASVLAQVPGRWVAVDRQTNELRAVADSPYELTAEVRKRHLQGVAIVRAPDPSEPELVGLG